MEPQSTPSTAQETGAPPTPAGFSWRAALLIALLVIAFSLGGWFSRNAVRIPTDNSFSTPAAGREEPVVVDVSGAVKHPGVYTLPFNSRVYQAIAKAGGALPSADLTTLNQATWVEDGSLLEIPSKK